MWPNLVGRSLREREIVGANPTSLIYFNYHGAVVKLGSHKLCKLEFRVQVPTAPYNLVV